ncbi:SDR family NAD(P)-dependent oxidoreductase [Spongisporangium articulatum]|uniref:SDR family NAD(P)-dependent oxidoreductase n=1 Tax=Spongisporangium articulatum TaxID=3362603 RepID=A0ABW8APH8_9ACTN
MTNRPRLLRRLTGEAWSGPREADLREAVTGRTVLITGASSGIGEATARRLARAGAHVVLVARRADLLDALASQLRQDGGSVATYPADLTEPEQVAELLKQLAEQQPPVDVFVNNAGRSIRRPVEEAYDRLHDYTRTMAINYLGPVQLTLGLLPAMRARGAGHIVNISTIGVDMPSANWSAYSASKTAFETWLTAAGAEARADGVASSSVHFGLVHTAMSAPTYAGVRGGMSARQAGDVVCRVIVDRPRVLRPWWARLGAVVWTGAPALTERMLVADYRQDRARRRRKQAQ